MTPTTLILPYYDNPNMLLEQYRYVCALPDELREQVHVMVVDDGSPQWPAKPGDVGGASLQIYRIEQDIRWNQDAARNIGVRHSETEWVLMTDLDHLVPEYTWREVIKRVHDPKTAYTFRRVSAPGLEGYKPHPNSWLMTRTIFNQVGGYDERFAGYYGTDGDFRNRMADEGVVVRELKQVIIRVPRQVIPDASTTTYLRKQPEDKLNIRRIKDRRLSLPEEERKPLRYLQSYHRVFPPMTKAEKANAVR